MKIIPSEDLLELNPYNTLPTLVDRELVSVSGATLSWNIWTNVSRIRLCYRFIQWRGPKAA